MENILQAILMAAENHEDSSEPGMGYGDLEQVLYAAWDAMEDWGTVRNTFLADSRVTSLLCEWGIGLKCEGCQTETAERWYPHDSAPGEVLCPDCHAQSA